MQLKHNGT